MKQAGRLLFVLTLALAFSVGAACASDYVYVTTNMTWAEFYAGELGASSSDLAVSYDAVSTATQRFATCFNGFTSAVSGDGTVFDGVKNVQVRMTNEVYSGLTDKSRFSTPINGSFDEYKEMDAGGNFGKMVTESVDANAKIPSLTVSVSGGKSTGHGNYRITISGLSYDVLGANLGTSNDNFLGAKLETTDGTVYGLKPLHNLWIRGNMAEQIGFCVEDFTERNGTHLSYAHTATLPGKTISTITYMLKNQPDIVIACSLPVKLWSNGAITVSGDVKSGANSAVHFTSSDIPNGASYAFASVAKVEGRTSTPLTSADYTYSNGVLTFTKAQAGSYTATFTSDSYVDIVASITVNDYYATTNMTWAEFYAGETGQTSDALLAAGLDAVSTPTVGHLSRFPLLWGATSPDYDGTVISGEKSVKVRMTGDVYGALSDKSRYTFTDETFSEYKAVSADGTFGATVSETATASGATVKMSTGSSARWGHYVISVSDVSIDIGTSGDKIARNYRGVLLETSDGKIYGMRHDNNLWSNTDIAFTVNANYTEPHGQGVKRFHEYTKELEGKTITKITYMLEGLPDVVIESLDLYVKPITSASVKPETVYPAGKNVPVKFVFTDVPDDAGYTLSSVSQGSGRNSKAVSSYTYADGVLTISGDLEIGTYTATFTSGKYADISAAINVYKFATTDMTWAEFYAGELGKTSADLKTSGLDAVSSPTARIANNFSQLTSVSNDIGGRDITGVKAVQVRFDSGAYTALSNDSRFTFVDEAFTQYKQANSDGTFGAMVSETQTMTGAGVTLNSGASATWGNYVLNITGLDGLVLSSGDENYYLGAILETSDGAKYGLRHNTNLWFNAGTVAFTVNNKYTEPHGVTRDYAYTSDLAGKTVTRLTFLVKNQPSAIVDCSVLLKSITDATVATTSAITAGENVPIAFTFGNLPSGVTYTLNALYSGTGRGRTPITDYTYSNGTLTVNGSLPAGTYQAIFGTDNYADIGVVFEVNEKQAEETYHFATTNMTWAEFYAGELGESSADLYTAGLDAISSPTARVAARFTQLTSESNDIGGRSITGVAAVQVRMSSAVYEAMSNDSRYTFTDDSFSEYKDVNDDGSFGKMLSETHVQEGATVTLTSPGTWGDYQLSVASVDVTVSSGDEYYYLGAIVETSDGKLYAMRHNNNLWFNAKDIALSTAEFVEPHGVARSYAYTSDMEGKTITRITYMLKNLPDEIVDCEVFLKLKTSASVLPVYEDGYHAFMAWTNLEVPLVFSGIPASADYKLSGVTRGTGRNRQAVSGCTMSGDVLTISGDVSEGTYTATFTDETYANISATINVYTTNATDKIISADNNAAGLSFLLTPAGVSDATDAVLDAQNFVNATDYTVIASNDTAVYSEGTNQISGSGFTLNVTLNDVPEGKRAILGFSHAFTITPESVGENDFTAMSGKILALPDVAYGWRVPTGEQLRDMGLLVVGVYPDGVSRDITDWISSGLLVMDDAIMMSYGTVLVDREFTPSEEGKVYALSDEGEGTMNDGAADGKLTATWYVRTPGGSSSGDDPTPSPTPTPTPTPEPDSDDKPAPESDDKTAPDTESETEPGDVTPEAWTDETTALVNSYKDSGALASDGTIPDDSVTYDTTSTTAHTLSRTGTTLVRQGEDINPISLVLEFPVDIWRVYVNDILVAWAYSPGVSANEFFAADKSSNGVEILPSSKTEATILLDSSAMSAGVNEISAAFVPDVANPSQEIAKSTLATVNIESSSAVETGVGNSSGGCNGGLAVSVILLGLGFALARKK